MEGIDFNWITAPLPSITGESVQNIFGASASIPVTNPEQELAAWVFLKYLISPEVQATWVQNSKYLPIRIGAADHLDGWFKNDKNYQTALELMIYGIAEPSLPGYDLVHQELELALEALYSGEEILGIMDSLTAVSNRILVLQLEQ